MQNFQIRPSSYCVIFDILCSLTYRMHMHVTKVRIYKDRNMFAVCPRCNSSVEFEYQRYCSSYGQHLEWTKLEEAEETLIGWDETEE